MNCLEMDATVNVGSMTPIVTLTMAGLSAGRVNAQDYL